MIACQYSNAKVKIKFLLKKKHGHPFSKVINDVQTMIAVYEKAELAYASRGEGGGGCLGSTWRNLVACAPHVFFLYYSTQQKGFKLERANLLQHMSNENFVLYWASLTSSFRP